MKIHIHLIITISNEHTKEKKEDRYVDKTNNYSVDAKWFCPAFRQELGISPCGIGNLTNVQAGFWLKLGWEQERKWASRVL